MLNEKETEVLVAIKEAHKYAGGDYAYAAEIECSFSVNKIKRYLSQLQTKGFITCDEYHKINFLKKSVKIIPDLEESCEIY